MSQAYLECKSTTQLMAWNYLFRNVMPNKRTTLSFPWPTGQMFIHFYVCTMILKQWKERSLW